MSEVTQLEAELAFAIVEYFRDYSLDRNAEYLPDVDELKMAVATLVLRHQIDEKSPWMSKLIRLLESRKAISFVNLNARLEPLYKCVSDIRDRENEKRLRSIGPPLPDLF